jgi:hypothetical protein
MSEELVEFRWLESKLVGNDSLVFTLEDGAKVIVKVEIMKAGVHTDDKGEPIYHFEFNNICKVIPAKKTFKIKMLKGISKEAKEKYVR